MSERKYKKTLRNHRPPYRPADWKALQAQLPQQEPQKRVIWWRWAAVLLLLLITSIGVWNGIDRDASQNSETAVNIPTLEEGLGKARGDSSQEQAPQAAIDSLHRPQNVQPSTNILRKTAQNNASTTNTLGSSSDTRAKGSGTEPPSFNQNSTTSATPSPQEAGLAGKTDKTTKNTLSSPEEPPKSALLSFTTNSISSLPPSQVPRDSARGLRPSIKAASPRPLLAVVRGERAWRLSVSAGHLPVFGDSETNATPDIALTRQWTWGKRITGEIGLSLGSHHNEYIMNTQLSQYERQETYLRTSIFAGVDYHFLIKRKWSLYAGLQAGRTWYDKGGWSVFAQDDESTELVPGDLYPTPPMADLSREGYRAWNAKWFIGPRLGAKLRVYRGVSAFTEFSTSMNIVRFGISLSTQKP